MVAGRDGAVAWIVEVTNPPNTPEGTREIQLRRSTAGRSSVLLGGAEIKPGSLALAGSTPYWTEAGQSRSAELP